MNNMKDIFYGSGKKPGKKSRQAWLFIFLIPIVMLLVPKQTMGQANQPDVLLSSLFLEQIPVEVDIEIIEMPLEEALRVIAREANVGISFDAGILPKENISAKIENEHIVSAVSKLIDGLGLQVLLSQSGKSIIIKEAADVFQETVTGRVLDEETGEPLPGVNVVIQGTATGVAINLTA